MNRFVAEIETGPHRRGKPDQWAVYEVSMGGAMHSRRSRHESEADAKAEAARLNAPTASTPSR
jgi:hypothetical protein